MVTQVRQPPVIPEIAKAYENDPRTKAAIAAITSGGSTAPVAAGGYGYADGIARVLRGAIGGYMNRQQEDKYGTDQDKLLAQRQARGVDALTGTGAVAAQPPPAPPPPLATPTSTPNIPQVTAPPVASPANASAIAGALQGQPPPSVPPGPTAGPPQPNLPPLPPQGAPPVQGGGPVGQPPFPVSAAPSASAPAPVTRTPPRTVVRTPGMPSFIQAPVDEPVRDLPAPVARPAAATAVGPTRSKLLDAAYRIMSDANPYESASGQEMYASGLSDQDKLNEAAAQRQQHLQDMEHQADLGMYTQGSEADRNAAIAAHVADTTRNENRQDKYRDEQFQFGSEKSKEAFEAGQNALKIASEQKIANMRNTSMYGTQDGNDAINQAEADGRLDPMAVNTRNRAGLGSFLAANPKASPLNIHAFAMGTSAAARATGNRTGATAVATSEVPGLAMEARDAHKALQDQGNFVPWNVAVQKVQNGTSSPALTRAMTATDAVAKAYARSFGTGAVSVNSYKDAQSKLQNAWGTPGYEAALDQIIRTTNIERSGAQAALDASGNPNARTPPPAPAGPSKGWGKVTQVSP